MPRVTPKTNWTSDPDNAPLPSDFKRIEGNSQQAFDEIDEKQANIDAEEARAIADVDAEEARAIAAEASLQSQIDVSLTGGGIGSLLFGTPNGVATTYNYGNTISLGGTVSLLPAGLSSSGDAFPSIAITTGTWRCLGFCISTSYRYTLWIRIS